jgi:hypothetical protein
MGTCHKIRSGCGMVPLIRLKALAPRPRSCHDQHMGSWTLDRRWWFAVATRMAVTHSGCRTRELSMRIHVCCSAGNVFRA